MTEIDDEEHISKVLGSFKLVLNRQLKPLRLYGQDAYVDMLTEQIVQLAWQLHWKLSGIDVAPYEYRDIHW